MDRYPTGRRDILHTPEVNVAIFAFLLNFVWEIWQAPFFASMPDTLHWTAVKVCTRATTSDVAILLIAFWGVAGVKRSRAWIPRARWLDVAGFTLIGFAITVLMERLATGPLDRWRYADMMPIVPLLSIGLLPALQWVILPPLVLWFARRQLN